MAAKWHDVLRLQGLNPEAWALESVETNEAGTQMRISLFCREAPQRSSLAQLRSAFASALHVSVALCVRFDEGARAAHAARIAEFMGEAGAGEAAGTTGAAQAAVQVPAAAHQTPVAQALSAQAPAVAQSPAPAAKTPAKPFAPSVLLGKTVARVNAMKLSELGEQSGRVVVTGKFISQDSRLTRDAQKTILSFLITDYENTVKCKCFLDTKAAGKLTAKLKGRLTVRGQYEFDQFSREWCLMAQDIQTAPSDERGDNAPQKRVELHLHTQLSSLDGLTRVEDAVRRAAQWGHPALAITDHGVVQAFPQAFELGKKHGVKILFGMEGNLFEDCMVSPECFVVFDLETTGLSPAREAITEIGAVRVRDGEVQDSFSTLVNPGKPIPAEITKLTGITDEMVKDAPPMDEALAAFAAFAGEDALCAHNAPFDASFLAVHGKGIAGLCDKPVADTLALSRRFLTGISKHNLGVVAEHLGVELKQHHRALDDATATAHILLALLERWRQTGEALLEAQPVRAFGERGAKRSAASGHILLLAQNETGLKNLYRLVTYSHLQFFHRKPRIPRSLLEKYREGLLLGSACERGELYQALLAGAREEELSRIAKFYDFLEIMPTGNNAFMIRKNLARDEAELQAFNQRIVALGEACGIPVVATGDVHFLEPHDAVLRRIIMHAQDFDDALEQAPLFLRTTEEMLGEFAYLGEAKAHEVVIYNPQRIAEMCESLRPFPDGTFMPKIDGAKEGLQDAVHQAVTQKYGENPHPIVAARLQKELHSITTYGFEVLYFIARQLVQKSLSDGYLVGSRGSVGSSLVATMAGITEVNPLPPHYLCPQCKLTDFDVDRHTYATGVDLPARDCPACGHALCKEGFDIPFEVFLGFKGDKVPDIDLNFSGTYQPVAHKYAETLVGKGYAYRAGTISSLMSKKVYGMVKKYEETLGLTLSRAEIERLVQGCCGVKQTTGQHPGGIVVVPRDSDIFDFTPLQHPADKSERGIVTTHFDFDSLHDRLVKLDILGHDDPTALHMLHKLTGLAPQAVPLDDGATMSLFSSIDALELDAKALGSEVGTYGIPEFGTGFVRQMLLDTRPSTMEELIRIAGLSHGTDVWINNAHDLVVGGTATLKEVICTRDDIMNFLISKGVEELMAFQIMEQVRKGKGVSEAMEKAMNQAQTPAWFIDSCKKIKYMFPRAHAVAYVMMAFRIAYFKVHHPAAFYATYFSVRADALDAQALMLSAQDIRALIKSVEAKGNAATEKEKKQQTVLEVALEMKLRGMEFARVELMRSEATRIVLQEDGRLLLPFSSLEGMGEQAAQAIVTGRKSGEFISCEDLMQRARVGKVMLETLRGAGCLEGLSERNQISMF